MSLGGKARPVVRALRATPGYPWLRRRVIVSLRNSTTARRVSRSAFTDLRDAKEVAETVDHEVTAAVLKAVSAAVQEEQDKAAVALHEQRVKHSTRVKALLAEHKEKLRRTKADFARREDRRRRALPPVSAGDLVAGLYLPDRPLILFDVRAVDPTVAQGMVEEVALEQVIGCGFRPMFLAGLDDAPVWRRYGHLCEVVPATHNWSGSVPYEAYLADRLESIRRDLGARWVLHVPPGGLTDTQRAFIRRCGR